MRHNEEVALRSMIRIARGVWILPLLLPLLTTHCTGSCGDETYCQFDDLGNWCAVNAGRCTTVGASEPKPVQGANVYAQSPWTFAGFGAQSITIPIADHRSELATKPLLHVVARANGNYSFGGGGYPQLLIDSSPADCEFADFDFMIEWRCAPSAAITTLEVDHTGAADFGLTVALEELQCTGSRRVCQL